MNEPLTGARCAPNELAAVSMRVFAAENALLACWRGTEEPDEVVHAASASARTGTRPRS